MTLCGEAGTVRLSTIIEHKWHIVRRRWQIHYFSNHHTVTGPQELGLFPVQAMRSLRFRASVTCFRWAPGTYVASKSVCVKSARHSQSLPLQFGSLSMLFLWFRSTFDACIFTFETSNSASGLIASSEQKEMQALSSFFRKLWASPESISFPCDCLQAVR